MWRKLNILCLILICVGSAIGQEDKQREKQQFIIAPPENLLLVIASQPDCPLQFENAKLIVGANNTAWGGWYQLRNRGTKPIRKFTVAEWTTLDTGQARGYLQRDADGLVMPNQLAAIKDSPFEIVPLTDELRDKLALRGAMRGMVVLMVVKVEYADGTTYSDEPAFKALKVYLHEVSSKVDRE